MATKDYSQLASQADVQNNDLVAVWRGSGPLKTVTAAILKTFLGSDFLPLSGGTLTGVLAIVSGTEALPGVAFSSDLNTGLWRAGADEFSAVAGGLRVATFNADGVTVAAGKTFLGDLTGNADTASTATTISTSASTTEAGKVELATVAETSAGTDATRAVTPDGLGGSIYGTKVVEIAVSDPGGSAITTGDGKAYLSIPIELNGMDLVSVGASVSTVSSSGNPTIQVRRLRSGVSADMLSTAITIDANERDSATAATPPVINTSNDDVATADQIYVDIDGAGTGAKGLNVRLGFRIP